MKLLLKVENLTVKYPDFTLHAADFSMEQGESIAVLGESGSGKTTLARAVACLIEEGNVNGRVWLSGHDLMSMREKQRKQLRMTEIAVCFQNSAQWLNPSLDLEAQIGEILAKKYPRKEHRMRAEYLINQFGLKTSDLARYPKELSGGMIQRFMLACAVALEPKLIILDEPTSSLDYHARDELIELIRKIRRESKTAFLIITHDIVIARELCERTMVLYGGEIVEAGETGKLLSSARHPYTHGLMQSFIELNPYRDLWGIRISREEENREEKTGCCFCGRCTQAIDVCATKRPTLVQDEKEHMVACHRGGVIQILKAEGISKKYGKQSVLEGVNLHVYAGELVAIVGRSGAGKTSLCSVLSGFLQQEAGEILFEGEAADYEKLHKSFGGLQMVMQDSEGALDSRMCIGDAVAEPMYLAGVSEAKRLEETMRVLKDVGLPLDATFRAKRVRELSGGQKQRINLARALTMAPKLLIADEPTSMLDASSKANVLRMLKGLQNEEGFALLMVTHDLDGARKIADRVYYLHNKKLSVVDTENLQNIFQEEKMNGK